jgi:hypothetical protein
MDMTENEALNEELFLILHKVRGEPAYDIAQRMDVEQDDEPWYLIPTSGHRAYPYAKWPLEQAYKDVAGVADRLGDDTNWPDWPDHYEVNAAPGKGKFTGGALLERLGLRKPSKPFKRRW